MEVFRDNFFNFLTFSFFFFFGVKCMCVCVYFFSTAISSDDTEPSSKAKTEINI